MLQLTAVKSLQVLDQVTLQVWLEELLQQADHEEEEVVVLLIPYLRVEQVELAVVLDLKQHFMEDFVGQMLFEVQVAEQPEHVTIIKQVLLAMLVVLFTAAIVLGVVLELILGWIFVTKEVKEQRITTTNFNSFAKFVTSLLSDFFISETAVTTHLIITSTIIHLRLRQFLNHHFISFHLGHAIDQAHRIRRLYQTCLDCLIRKIQRIHSTYLFIDLCTQLELKLLLQSDL